jgi:hypothetical protein
MSTIVKISRRRWVTNFLSFTTIALVAAIGFPGPGAVLGQDGRPHTCRSGNGQHECTGSTCCADADQCSTDRDTCITMFCSHNRDAPIC